MNVSVKVGERLQVVRVKKNGEEECLASQMIELLNEDILDIAMPIKEGRLVPLHVDSVIKVVFYRENGQYYFEAKVLEKIKGKIPVLRVQRISKIYKLQRRDYYRLNVVLPLKIHIADSNNGEEARVLQTFTLDISGGGLRFSLCERIEKDQVLLCELNLNDRIYSLKARVVRVNNAYDKDYAYEVGVEFIDIDERIRQDILCFVFDQQRKMRRKGMI